MTKKDAEAADAAALKQFKRELKAGALGQLYLFHGEEAYLRDFYLGEMRKKLLSGGMEEFNLHVLQAKECGPRALGQVVDCLPMMAERTLVVVYDYDLFKAPAQDRKAAGQRSKPGLGDTRRSVEKREQSARPVRKAGWAKPKKKK